MDVLIRPMFYDISGKGASLFLCFRTFTLVRLCFLSSPGSESLSDGSAGKTDGAEEEDELQAVATYFGKDLEELTLEALIKLEQKRPQEEEEAELEEDAIPRRHAPSLASILGPMPSAATLSLTGDGSRDEKENGE